MYNVLANNFLAKGYAYCSFFKISFWSEMSSWLLINISNLFRFLQLHFSSVSFAFVFNKNKISLSSSKLI